VDFEFSADQELLRDSVRRFLADRAPIAYVRRVNDDDAPAVDDVWRGLCDLGVVGLGMVDAAVVLEELGRAVCPVPYVACAVGAYALGDEPLRAALADGSAVATVALHEDARRYDWRTPSVQAERDGDGWLLRGTKVHVPDAAGADVVLVTATDRDGALCVFAVDRADAAVTPTPTVDGSRKEGRVALDGARARRIGDGDRAADVARCVDRMAVAHVVDGVGAAQHALEMAVAYAKERVQFGRPIGSFQAVQHLCADMLRMVELARAAAYYACWAADEADPAEAHRAATLAKAYASEALPQVGAAAIQVFGGVGFTWEHDVHLFYKRLLTLGTVLGNASAHLEELATITLG
jgi:acyl-CoA dehydrogenase